MDIWDKEFTRMANHIKETFKEKGIPLPEIVIDFAKEPITYGIKTIIKNNNQK